MEHSVREVSDWLDAQKGRSLTITKEEDGDLDQVFIQLNDIRTGQAKRHDPDGYVAQQALLLLGRGVIRNGRQEAHLPQDVFEIPLHGEWMIQNQGEELKIKTDRALYTIKPH